MKKLIAIFAVLLFAAPAMAADWAFYGSQRIATWYTDRDYGDATVNGQDDDQATQWYFQGNSRLGAKVKADKISGQIEFGLGKGGDGGDTTALAGMIVAHGRLATQAALRAIRAGLDSPLAEGLARESELFGELCQTPDKKEGLQAFLGKRSPVFVDAEP